jgi:hypothetical protein
MTHWLDKPLLFLDFDGVLNSTSWAIRTKQRGIWGIDPDTIPHLQRIVDETGCNIVVSSTWRIGRSRIELIEVLHSAGMRIPCPVIDKTPVHGYGRYRGNEVADWLESNGYAGKFVCLDDDGDYLPGQPLVQTSCEFGLTAEHADRCILILSGQPQ